MTTPKKPNYLRASGALIMLFAAILGAGILYIATEVYPEKGWGFGQIEGKFFGLCVVFFLFGFWVFCTNQPTSVLLTKLDRIKWWQWMITLWLLFVLTFASLVAMIVFMLHR